MYILLIIKAYIVDKILDKYMNIKLLKVLRDVGLNENEARVYLALLSLGPSGIQNIARSAEIKRTTCYNIIESLKLLGLVKSELAGWKKLLVAIDPEQLGNLLEQRRKKFQENLQEFQVLSHTKEKGGVIQYYEGLEAVKSVYESLIKDIQPHEDYLIISNIDDWYRLDPQYFEKFTRRRAKLNIKIRLLLIDSPVAKKYQQMQKNYNQTIKILPKNTKFKVNLVVTPQRIAIHQLTMPIMAIVIENKSIITMQQQLFEVICQIL